MMIGVRRGWPQRAGRADRRLSGIHPSRGLICCGVAAAAGMTAPVFAVGDGALGVWKPLREVFPDREQRCWWHKQANVLAALPKSAHPGALAALREIYNAEAIDKAQVAIKAFELDYGAKYPQVVAKIVDDADVLLEFYRYPSEHWIHLRTTNPIESTFSHSAIADQSNQRTRLARSRPGDGLQANRGRGDALARGQCTSPGRPRPQRRGLPQRETPRTAGRHHASRTRYLLTPCFIRSPVSTWPMPIVGPRDRCRSSDRCSPSTSATIHLSTSSGLVAS